MRFTDIARNCSVLAPGGSCEPSGCRAIAQSGHTCILQGAVWHSIAHGAFGRSSRLPVPFPLRGRAGAPSLGDDQGRKQGIQGAAMHVGAKVLPLPKYFIASALKYGYSRPRKLRKALEFGIENALGANNGKGTRSMDRFTHRHSCTAHVPARTQAVAV